MKQRTEIAVERAAKVKYAACVFWLILAKVITCSIFNLAELRPPPAAVQITIRHCLWDFLVNEIIFNIVFYHLNNIVGCFFSICGCPYILFCWTQYCLIFVAVTLRIKVTQNKQKWQLLKSIPVCEWIESMKMSTPSQPGFVSNLRMEKLSPLELLPIFPTLHCHCVCHQTSYLLQRTLYFSVLPENSHFM